MNTRIYRVSERRMTDKQRAYYDFIREYIRDNKISPSIYDVAKHFDVFPSTASRMIQKLDYKGFLMRPPATRRTVICKPLPKDDEIKDRNS